MKVAINQRPLDGPWGGGNRFVAALIERLNRDGHQVVHDLEQTDIDIILLVDPRTRSPNIFFGAGGIFRYLWLKNPRAIVVHRINECDERKNTRTMNFRLRVANYCADHTVFVGTWLKDLNVWQRQSGYSVILNGADQRIFKPLNNAKWNGKEPLKLVTHHWGGNWMKGFDIYSCLDHMLSDSKWSARISFTYIGNLPKNFVFKNVRYIAPLNGDSLAAELCKHHGYISASINEPGGHHQNEGALCGLPLLFRRSGCLPEYCSGFGVDFDEFDFEERLGIYLQRYSECLERMPAFSLTSDAMCERYMNLFNDLLVCRDKLVAERRLWRDLRSCVANQVFG